MKLGSGSSRGDSPVPEHASAKSAEVSLPALFNDPLIPAVNPPPRVMVPPFDQLRRPSPSALSQSSDDGRNLTTRVAALEARMDRFEEWRVKDARWKKQIDHKLTDLGL
jgi:hypothetical protein